MLRSEWFRFFLWFPIPPEFFFSSLCGPFQEHCHFHVPHFFVLWQSLGICLSFCFLLFSLFDQPSRNGCSITLMVTSVGKVVFVWMIDIDDIDFVCHMIKALQSFFLQNVAYVWPCVKISLTNNIYNHQQRHDGGLSSFVDQFASITSLMLLTGGSTTLALWQTKLNLVNNQNSWPI